MHPDVYTALMNYFDAGVLTAGNGETVRRPGHVVVGAANAGAERLHRHMSERQVKDVLAEAFTDRHGHRRPELVRRFEAVPMLALEREAFLAVLRASLETLGRRFGFVNANLRLVGVDDSAVDLLYEASREVCAYSEEGLRHIGFRGAAPGVRVCTPAQLAGQPQLFFDMRHVSRAFEQLGGESVRRFAEEQYERGWHRRRRNPRRVKLVGDPARGRILLADVTETNGHTQRAGGGRRAEQPGRAVMTDTVRGSVPFPFQTVSDSEMTAGPSHTFRTTPKDRSRSRVDPSDGASPPTARP
jgi:hypothetical protein